MRVDYMLPGLFPPANSELTRASVGGEAGVSHPALPLVEAPGLSWRQMLGLSRQAGVPVLKAPPTGSRSELRNGVHSAVAELGDRLYDDPANKRLEKAQAMFTLLLHYENLADQLMCQTLTERRG